MEISHKTQAAIQFLAPSAIIYVLFGAYLLNNGWPSLSLIEKNSASVAVVGIAAMLAQDLVPKPVKEALVFWRAKNRLPGHKAFTPKFMRDPRIDIENIPNLENLSVASGNVQQREFYRLYKSVADVRSVAHYSQRYIAWRDLSALLMILGFVSVPVLYSVNSERGLIAGITLAATALLSFLFTSFAARNTANELVIQVLLLIGHGARKDG